MRDDLTKEGLRRLLHTIRQWNGFDLFDYTHALLQIHIEDFCEEYNISSLADLTEKVSISEYWYEKLLDSLLMTDTEIFRDPVFWRFLRDSLFASIKGKIKVWFPDLGSGEELYSLLIAAKEAGRLQDLEVTASSMSQKFIDAVKNGFVPGRNFSHNADNYKRFQGFDVVEDYFIIQATKAYLKPDYLSGVTFRLESFMDKEPEAAYDLILFRNKMIYFNDSWKGRALQYLTQALKRGGYLCIGIKESMGGSSVRFKYMEYNQSECVFKKR